MPVRALLLIAVDADAVKRIVTAKGEFQNAARMPGLLVAINSL